MTNDVPQPPGWFQAQGDPPGTQRYWDGVQWQGGPQPIPGLATRDASGRALVGGYAIAPPEKRIAARLIDWFVWLAVVFAGGVALSAFTAVSFDGDSTTSGAVQLLVVVGFVGLLGLYEVAMVAMVGGTIGKLALGLRVRTEEGAAIDTVSALIRFSPIPALVAVQQIPIIGGIGSIAIVVAGTVGLLMLFGDARMQVPWDKLAKTIVVEAGVVEG